MKRLYVAIGSSLLASSSFVQAVSLTSPIDVLTTGTASPTPGPVTYKAVTNIRLKGIDELMNTDEIIDVFNKVTRDYIAEQLSSVAESLTITTVAMQQQELVHLDLLTSLSEPPTTPPTSIPTNIPETNAPFKVSSQPTSTPSTTPTIASSDQPSFVPTVTPSMTPSLEPSSTPSVSPSAFPSDTPSGVPSVTPSSTPSLAPTATPSVTPSSTPSTTPSATPSSLPSSTPSTTPSTTPTGTPSVTPTITPSSIPTMVPSDAPSAEPTRYIRDVISKGPTQEYEVDAIIDSIRGRKRKLPGKKFDLAVRFTTVGKVNPYKPTSAVTLSNNNDLTKLIYPIFSEETGNLPYYNYKLFEAHEFFKDIKPIVVIDPVFEPVNTGNQVIAEDDSNDESAADGLGEALFIVSGITGMVCIIVIGVTKFRKERRYGEERNRSVDEDGDSTGVAQSEVGDEEAGAGDIFQVETLETCKSAESVEFAGAFEPFVFEEGSSFQTAATNAPRRAAFCDTGANVELSLE